jgi:hypothetical protein
MNYPENLLSSIRNTVWAAPEMKDPCPQITTVSVTVLCSIPVISEAVGVAPANLVYQRGLRKVSVLTV